MAPVIRLSILLSRSSSQVLADQMTVCTLSSFGVRPSRFARPRPPQLWQPGVSNNLQSLFSRSLAFRTCVIPGLHATELRVRERDALKPLAQYRARLGSAVAREEEPRRVHDV